MTKAKNPDKHGRMSELLDKHMIKWLEEGTPLIDQDGRAVLDGKGQPIMRALTPAEADKIMKRLAQIGNASGAVAGVGKQSTADELERKAEEKIASGQIKFKGKAIPPLDVESADAATGAA